MCWKPPAQPGITALMTQDPPDSQWADLLAQVGDALRQAGIDGDELHAAVAEGLLEALVTLDLEPELQPEVDVVDGGEVAVPLGESTGRDHARRSNDR